MLEDDSTFDAIFAIFPVIFVVVLIGIIVVAAMNWKKASDAGVNPLTMETEAMTTFIKSKAMASERTVEERLAEIDALRDKGTITAEEHAAARAEVLKDL